MLLTWLELHPLSTMWNSTFFSVFDLQFVNYDFNSILNSNGLQA